MSVSSTPVNKLLIFLVLFLVVGISVGKQMLLSLGMETNYLLIALLGLAFAGLVAHRQLLLIILTLGLAAAVNLPAEVLADYGVDGTVLLSVLVAVAGLPLFARLLQLDD